MNCRTAYCTQAERENSGKPLTVEWRKREDWEATRGYNLWVCLFFFFRSVLFFSKGYIFVLNIIHYVSFTLFLIKPSLNMSILEFFFQRTEILQTFHKKHKKCARKSISHNIAYQSFGISIEFTLNGVIKVCN